MLSIYDLYDLSAVYTIIRQYPEYELNTAVLEKILEVFSQRGNCHNFNQIRTSLSSIPNIDTDIFDFICVKNIYTYYPSLLKDESIYLVLIKSTELLLNFINERNLLMIIELADCLHNLPSYIANNNLQIPSKYWRSEILTFRKKWDKRFLLREERKVKKTFFRSDCKLDTMIR